ncbi:hypothetical protein BFJ67_g5694 [Fusarium oxysporum f. sp. cepae]|nr:hypothetical protein BFJ67_g5694 [Fusarium oxysporum f. sp. cepae]
MMLCAVCMSMFQTNVKQGLHHKDYKSVATAAKNGCRICYYLSRKLSSEDLKPLEYEVRWENSWELHWEIEFYETGSETSIDDGKSPIYSDRCVFVDVSSSSKPPTGYEEFLGFVAADRGSEPTRVRTEFPSLRDIPNNTGHQNVARLAKRWLQTCKDRHDCGSASEDDWHPKRLIHVGNEQQSPRLIISENERPEGCYAALSHCWGEDPKFFMLTSDNLFDLCSEIQLQSLPASFRDAIITCRRIGIPYIWIDSLCILQSGLGSHEDWLSHSEDMHLVYHHCDLNISIDVSENPHGGAFRSRNPTYLQDCYVWTPFYAPPKSSSKSEHDIGDGTEESDLWSICAIFTADDFSWARVDLPLSDRAWVFQERLLSPRTLHFGSDRISWECDRSHNLTEYLPEGVSDKRWNGFDCLAQNAFSVREKGDLFTYYYDLVFPYTNRQLSHPDEDKLVAFAAVARRCISWFGSDYCAGIFRSTMPQGLLWEMSALGQLGRSKIYRAPSWSWASLDCRVRFDILDGEGAVLVDVVDVAVELVDPNNQFGQVKSASLILNGPLVASDELILKDANDEEFLTEGRPGRDGYQDIQTILGHTFGISADTVHLWEEAERKAWLISQKNMYLLAVLETSKKPHTYGLLLQKNDDGTFTRAGNWEAGPGESSTTSISSSILEYRKFQGRTFHSERYNTEYFTPNDEQQRDSIDITHHVLTLLLDGKPTLVPLKDNIQVSGTSGHRNVRGNIDKLKRVLDVGTGTVTLLMNTPTLKSSEHTSPQSNQGGFVESGEINPTFYSDDGTIDDVEALQTWNKLVIKSGKGFGRSFTDIENDVQLFREAGLVDVKSFDFKAPIGGWPKDEKMRKVGQFLRASIENDLEGYTMMAWHHIMSWPKDEYQVFLMNMRKAFKDKRIHGYMRVRYVYDRKPDVEE